MLMLKQSLPCAKQKTGLLSRLEKKEDIAAMKRLKNNKAVDVMRLTSEHFKLGGCSLVGFLTALLNYLISAKRVSAVLKEGILTPIFKKGHTSDPGNYRSKTVTPVLMKILEHILNTRYNDIFCSAQSRLQRGFTEGCSSLNGAVILTECLMETAHHIGYTEGICCCGSQLTFKTNASRWGTWG